MTESREDAAGAAVLAVLRELLQEGQGNAPQPDLDSRLERDLGLDSLGRAELLTRLERRTGARLPERLLEAETPRELQQALLQAEAAPQAAPATDRIEAPSPGTAEAPRRATTLTEVLAWHARRQPQRVALHLYADGATAPEPIDYNTLWRESRALAAGLRERGIAPGQTVALMLPTGRDYFVSFFGILLAGATPVPIYPPLRPSQLEEHLRRHTRLLANAEAALLLTVAEARPLARLLGTRVPGLRGVVTAADLARPDADTALPPIDPGALAFVQYSSGSTGDPKGVMLSHANLLANIRAMIERIEVRPDDVFVSWLPLYHDMGLIGACLGSLYQGIPLAVMSPLRFLRRPAEWLWAIHRHRGTLSAAPNFAYALCLQRIADEELEGLDLSSLRFVANGAEPVSADTLRRFGERFAHYGLDPAALAPVYGLAECAVGLALPAPGRGLRTDRVQAEPLRGRGEAVPAAED
ncbi:MAG: AMP-binding protein, partial [Candidatus Competibacterales bacterium]|nr:AMP-binding protein [Candidatus Competibacterales bacterium]